MLTFGGKKLHVMFIDQNVYLCSKFNLNLNFTEMRPTSLGLFTVKILLEIKFVQLKKIKKIARYM